MKQRLLCILLALVGMMSGAHAQEAYSVKLIEDGYYGDSKSVAITALRPGETVPEDIYQSIKENECELYPGTVVTLTIGVDEGWYVSKVMAITSITTEQMQAPRRTNETNLLTQVPVTKGEGGTWTFTMPEANVEIYIKYLNTPPYFINMDQTKLVAPENTVGARVGTIKAMDDQGDAFTYEILGGTGEDLFEINLTTGVVSLRNGVEPFDFEEWKDAGGVGYTLVIGVCDTRAYNFDDVFGTQATFTVNISDKNEKPYFTNETDVIYIAEGATTSTDVMTYADIDKYATGDFVNNELTIISDESNLFEISADGHIKTKEGVVLDYETQKDQVFTLVVRVRDANKDTDGNYIYPDLYEDKTFKVKVSDVNEAPTFKAEAYNYELLATERTEQVLGTVETTDPDTYSTNFSTITYSLEGDDAANFKIDATTGKISLTNGAAFNYADKSVYRFNAVANDTKNKVTVPVTVTLKRKQLTITADNKSKTFGATDPELTYQVEGLVGNDKLTVELSREKGEELGSYAIDAVITASSNYDVQFTKGAFTITACTDAIVVTITGNTLKAEFDGKTQTVSGYTVACNNELYDINKYVNFTGDSIVSGTDVKTYDMGLTESQFANTAAGFTNVTFKVTDGTLTITPKAVTITAQSHAFTYTGETQSWPQYDVEGLVGDDAIKAVVTGSITLPGESPVVNKVESYEFTKGTAGNYSVTTKNGELTMTNASVAITITAASGEWTYDGTAHSNSGVTITSGELLEGDVLVATAAGSVTNVADTEAGNNPVAAGYKVMHGETDVTASYAITTVAGTLAIKPKAVTITAQSHAFTYTGEAQSWAKYDVEGLVGDDAITAVVTGSITYPSQGTVANKVESYEFTKGTAGNYSVTTVNGELTMKAADVAITITAASQQWIYDGTAHSNSEVSITAGELLEGDVLVATAAGSATNVADTEAGNNPVAEGYKVMHGETDVTASYAITTVAGTLAIKPKAVTITAQSHAFTYTGEAQSWAKYDVEGLVGDDAIKAVVTGSITLPSESPVVNKIESYEFTKGTAGNYSVTTKNGELTMTAADVAITITAASQQWTYDGTAHTNTAVTITSGELLEGDVLVATAAGSATNVADTEAGNNPVAEGYKVMHGETDVTASYAITTVAGTLAIKPKAVTITAQSHAFTYTGEAQSWAKYDVEGLVGDDAITAVVTGSITYPSQGTVANKVESYEFTKGTAGNYSVTTVNGELTAAKAIATYKEGITVSKEIKKGGITYIVDCSSAAFDGVYVSDRIYISDVKVGSTTIDDAGTEFVTLDFSDIKFDGDNFDCYEIRGFETEFTVRIYSTIVVNDEGSTTETAVTKETNSNGGTTEVVNITQTDADGNVVSTTETTTETDDKGNVVTSSIEDKTQKNTDGSTTETHSTSVTDAKGVTTTASFEVTKDKDGNVVGSTETTETVSKDANGVTSMSSNVTEKDANGVVVNTTETTSTTKEDALGNVVAFNETKLQKNADGSTIETVTEKQDTDGSTHEKVTETKTNTDLSTTTTVNESQKNADGSKSIRVSEAITDTKGNITYTSTSRSTDAKGNVGSTTFEAGRLDKNGSYQKNVVKEDPQGNVKSVVTENMKKGKTTEHLTYRPRTSTAAHRRADTNKNFYYVDDAQLETVSKVFNTDILLAEELSPRDAGLRSVTEGKKGESESTTTNSIIIGDYEGAVSQGEFAVAAPSGMQIVIEFTKSDGSRLICSNGSVKCMDDINSPNLSAPEDNDDDIEIVSGQKYEVLRDDGFLVFRFTTDNAPIDITSIRVEDSSISTAVREFADTSKATDVWYTIDGRKLDVKPTKQGVYIQGGKKVMVK